MKFAERPARLYPLLVVLLSVFAIAPLEYPGAFESHNGLSAVYNLINLDQNPLQFYNWAPTFGRAFDLFRAEGPLPYWIAEIFHRVGFGYLDSIKLVYALAWALSGLTMFTLARKFFSDAGALLAAMVYVYLPFHIATVYVRGAFAEVVTWAWYPLALLAVVNLQLQIRNSKSYPEQSRRIMIHRTYLAPLVFAALFLTQPGLAILFSLLVIGVIVALGMREQFSTQPIGALVVSLIAGAILYSPAILNNGAKISANGFNPNFVLPFQLFSSLWGFGQSTGNFLDTFPFQLGVAPIGLAIGAVALGWRNGKEPSLENTTRNDAGATRRAIAVLLSAAMILTLLTFEIAWPIWNVLGIFVESPWQLLAFVGFALALAVGSIIDFDARFSQPAMLAFFVALPIIASYNYLSPRFLDATPTRPQIAIFGDNEIALLDYRIVGPLRHGATVRIEFTWQALRAVDHDYTVFVHALHEDGKTYASEDAKPVEGTMPTSKWVKGQVVLDKHTIQIDVDGPREGYRLEIGLYQAANGRRAILDNGSDLIILPRPGDPPPTISDQLPPNNSR